MDDFMSMLHKKKDDYFFFSSNPQLRLFRLNGLGFEQISYADGGK